MLYYNQEDKNFSLKAKKKKKKKKVISKEPLISISWSFQKTDKENHESWNEIMSINKTTTERFLAWKDGAVY